MATQAAKPIPDGMHTLTPHIICEGASDALAFYKKAFNAEELMRLPGPNGKIMHAAIRIDGLVVEESHGRTLHPVGEVHHPG